MQDFWYRVHQIPTPVIGVLFIIAFGTILFADAVRCPRTDPARAYNPPIYLSAARYIAAITVFVIVMILLFWPMYVATGSIAGSLYRHVLTQAQLY